ncbi:MAG: aerobic respiration control sensor protein ArcB [Methanomethylovorans sp. PtaU1.Bin093]|uniref:PAS domain-containing sensor histidine kinase n=1 Tax=Methanomethylovorans sp. PtaU1.Bin093 TaxID=1811679 RepID=UPI0009C8A364|nr:PAS domain S-box protein [Methanomethylovorans sp. PtaU1.Bin093]OPY20947.1 MAG: aerobic respiration control sensor protein ArcB [Methanomethylovorans sp. PtaU1.Bin093]
MISRDKGSDTVSRNSPDDELDISFITRSMNFQDPGIEILYAFMDAVPSMLLVLDTDQMISFVNECFCKGLGFTKKELIGRIWYDRLISSDKRYEARELFSKPADVKDRQDIEIPIVDEHAKEHPAVLKAGYLNDRNGNISRIILQIEMISSISEKCTKITADDKYRVLVENSVDVILSTDPAGVITYISPSVTTYGFTPDELLLKGLSDLFFYEDQHKIVRSLSITLNNSGQSRVQGRLKDPNGKLYWVELYAQAFFDKDGHVKGIIATIRDIGNRRADLNALEMASDMFISQARSASDAIIFSNPAGNIIFWNKGAENLFFYTVEEAMGMHISMIMPQRYRHIHQGWDIVVSTGRSWVMGKTIELYGLKRDGTEFPIEISHSSWKKDGALFFSVNIRDITQRVLNEKEMREAKDKYRMIFEKSPLGIIHFDTYGVITQCNKSFVDIVGVEEANIIGNIIGLDLLRSDTSEEIKKCVTAVLSGEPDNFSGSSFSFMGARDTPIRASFVPVITEDKAIAGGICIVEDITESKKAREALIHAKNVAEEASRTKSEFLSNVTHELRTPLNAIMGFSDLLQESIEDKLNENQRKYLNNIIAGGKDLLDVINNILDVSNIEAGKTNLELEDIHLEGLVQDVMTEMSSFASKKNIALQMELDPQVESIRVDRNKLQQILINLVSNAIKFGKEKGFVKIRSKQMHDTLHIEVIDNGIGISTEDQQRLFKPFIQLDSSSTRKYKGNGIGLYIVKQFVDLHGGNVWLESEIGKGSTFTFTISLKL